MTRVVGWWARVVASVALVVVALTNRSGACFDSADAAASSCTTTDSGGLLVVGLAAVGLSLWMLRRAYRAHRR